ncbi:bifunctional diaminohydroxyphosphoribosylaminopyrimidine deaminase/5-amino-6-(5-phosphoribosylamino)uracil reductase RibD [Heliobacterium chlorum]|uniref:Riboflavin biosynthesis protein RibD n=1 Tax=Heliobacterium chlorum TaxID=2698 RepID=A0ABR7SXS1_HELCL|nr:bifunctional diaminohydroxyphosphoribosylaminopyrimidine deaminase/5-amino-6-(5-phosphoribosylamino)uracil reductase RibD [Heliobacterium chlorum]MBC9783334.1 bifunctional diaminohydroxyphosphoribosylaminopyrimidine deaminase/5-amino-6-(5-phosphoribosylamino)uracil reductase RibD [Heliobacterium chlorum]
MIDDKQYMARALELASLARGRTSPNPVVGCVIVKDGQVVGEGYHEKAGTPHAEVHALRQAGDKAQGATLYVTLEPCSHYGRTPPCVEALIAAGIGRVVAAVPDPNPKVAGRGFRHLQEAGIPVDVGILAEEASAINQPFFTWVTRGRPWVLLKWAMTLDGKIATATGDSRWISGTESRRVVHQWRNIYDAVLVGIGTLLADDPELTVRLPQSEEGTYRNPVRVIVDSQARTPLTAKILSSEAPTIIATSERAPAERIQALEKAGAVVLPCPTNAQGKVDLPTLLKKLADRGLTSLLVEGGAQIHGSFLEQNLVDQVAVFVAPKVVGGDGASSPVGGRGVSLMKDARLLTKRTFRPIGDDWLLQGTIQEVKPCLPES